MADRRSNGTGVSLRIPSSTLHVENKTRIPYSLYVRIQAVGVTSCRIKKGMTNYRIKKMVEHTDNQKKRGNAENKTAFYHIRYRQANVSRISAITSCLEIVIASKSPVGRFFQKFCMTDDDDDRRTKPIT